MIEDVFGPEWESNDLGRATHEWVHGREAAVLGAPELGIDDWSTFMSANQLVMAEAIRKRLILQKKVWRQERHHSVLFTALFFFSLAPCGEDDVAIAGRYRR